MYIGHHVTTRMSFPWSMNCRYIFLLIFDRNVYSIILIPVTKIYRPVKRARNSLPICVMVVESR